MDEEFKKRNDVKKLVLMHNYEAGRLVSLGLNYFDFTN
jgi:hypothetical protein